ncbi:MAG TPA: CBS domain-containing protein [Thermoanaerobaculia bacterium]|nr:CBS domain-containing protein [Thermoanaerobaculia bacterium]
MKVKDVMTPSPAFATPQTSLQDVARMMEENDCGAIPIMESGAAGRPVGVVTDRDITIRAVAHGKNPLEIRAGDVMSGPPLTVRADASLDEAVDVMGKSQVRRLIIIDEGGACCGILSQADVAQHAAKRETAKMVAEVSEPVGVR